MKKLFIEGMHCASCASNIERSLKKIKGVKSVNVSLMTRKAIVDVDSTVKDDDLKKAISRTGYKLIKIEE
ncbi:heavy-metal-associated domain-containing protein [Candidatus Woesearchaeota archaeon]|nr:heavy-metal-associated domain-containing protein [Candidatus Woesearchaeota archaeon]